MRVFVAQALGLPDLSRVVREHWRLLFVPPFLFVMLTAGVTLARSARFTARAAFAPQSERMSLAGLSSLAVQLGVSVPGSGSADSPDLYAELVRSGPLLLQVVADSYPTRGGPIALSTYYRVREDSGSRRAARTAEALAEDLRVSVTPRSGLVRVSVRTRDAELSFAVLLAILERVNRFNVETRKTQARAEREFLEARIVSARSELRASEVLMGQFLLANRGFSRSPSLTFEHDQLDRDVARRTHVLTGLSEDLERARLSEVRNTPMITVVEPPTLPALPDHRGLTLRLLMAGTSGLLISGMLTLVIEWRRANGIVPPEARRESSRGTPGA